jgi:hypothetical protein
MGRILQARISRSGVRDVARVTDKYVGTTEAAAILNVSVPTVQLLFDQGKVGGIAVPVPRAAPRRLLLRADVVRLAAERSKRQ